MAYVIGDNVIGINTWAGVRGAVTEGNTPTIFAGNTVYPVTSGFFRTEEANGLLKRGVTDIFFPAHLTVGMNEVIGSLAVINFDEKYHSEMIGQDVENDSAEVYTIDATAFDPPDYQILTPGPSTTQVVDIGLFDPI